MWEGVQAVEHFVNASDDPLGHPTLSLQLLWEAASKEKRIFEKNEINGSLEQNTKKLDT
jgi:hypothetical protein